MAVTDRVETARKNRKGAAVKFVEFMKLYRINKEAVFCAVEGEDGKYYDSRVRSHLGIEAEFMELGGKEAVLDFHKIISRHMEYWQAKILFFIDRDFDPLVKNVLIYETPCYSIENFYTSNKVLSRILRYEFKLYPFHEDFKNCLSLFTQRQTEFHNCTLLLNAWIACQRDLNNSGFSARLDLNSFDMKKLVKIRLDSVSAEYDQEQLEALFSNAPKISPEVLEEKINQFKKENPQIIFRGKFELDFFRTFLEHLISDCRSDKPTYFSSKRPVKLNVSGTNAISALSSYAETPKCFLRYLRTSIPQSMMSFGS